MYLQTAYTLSSSKTNRTRLEQKQTPRRRPRPDKAKTRLRPDRNIPAPSYPLLFALVSFCHNLFVKGSVCCSPCNVYYYCDTNARVFESNCDRFQASKKRTSPLLSASLVLCNFGKSGLRAKFVKSWFRAESFPRNFGKQNHITWSDQPNET